MKVTLDYYRYRNDAMPDWGVPFASIGQRSAGRHHVPVTELGIPRDTWVGMAGLDFFKEQADIGTATVVAKLADGITLTNRSRAGQSRVDYVATSMEGYPDVHHPNRDQTRPDLRQPDRAERQVHDRDFPAQPGCRRGGHARGNHR